MAQEARYKILRELGRGGMGVVYLAQDTRLKREVAIKAVLPPQGQHEQEWSDLVRRLEREAQAAAALRHPNIVAVYDLIEDGNSPSIVMEYVKGNTLAELFRRGSQAVPSFVLSVLKPCAAALDYAHSRGIVHRDIKPANIMLDDAGPIKIADFGIAKMLQATTDLTHGLAIGTLEYMAPEQLEGRPVGASDQYSLAVVAYRMLTGSRIFEAENTLQWCWKIAQAEPLPASQVNALLPLALDAVLARALAKDAGARYGSCCEFLTELERALTPPAVHETPEIPASPAILLAKPTAAAAPDAGTVKLNPRDGLNYVWIPPGTFLMGCSPGDKECFDNEKPAHQVTLTKGFWIGQTPVTQAAWQRVMGKHSCHFKGAKLPVDSVSWDDAEAYCQAVEMRLPTEAEWEYAARGSNATSRYGALGDVAWFDGKSEGRTREVAQKLPNKYGLYDMLGNVWEWVADWYSRYEAGPMTDPTGPPTGTTRVLRGGSWSNSPQLARVSYRTGYYPVNRYNNLGFRCVGETIPS